MKQLILGGVRSGKSRLAERLALEQALPVTYIATANAGDDEEMSERIRLHQSHRPKHWTLIEEPLFLADALARNSGPDQCVLVECLTLWLTNLLINEDETLFDQQRDALLDTMSTTKSELIIVGNESNMGIIPQGSLSRRYCDESGRLHQELAQKFDRVILTVAGLPQILKGDML